MAEYKAGPRRREPTHPGRIVASSLEALRMSARMAAGRLGVTATALGNVIAGTSAVSPEMALRLGTFFDNGPELWLGMQADHDLWRARQALKAELAKIEPAPKEAA